MRAKHPENTPGIQQHPGRFISSVRSTIRRHRMLSPGDHVIAGVSGGADSVAMLLALHELKQDLRIDITVAHLNHGLRGEAAGREAEFVAALASRLALPCLCETRDVRAEKNASGTCIQEAARAVRYRFFNEILRRCGAQKLALGHTMDDQAETVLMRLLRGASTRGLGGIPPVRDGIIVRPLISMRRAAIERFLRDCGCDFIPDASAQEPQYLRNRIRHELLPLLTRTYNPRIVEALCTTAELAREDDFYLQAAAENALEGFLHRDSTGVRISVSLFERNPLLAGRIIKRAIESVHGSSRGLTSVHISAIAALTACTGSARSTPLPGGLIARREYEHIVIGAPDKPAGSYLVQVEQLPADVELPQAGVRVLIRRTPLDAAAPLKRAAGDTLLLSADSITLPLVVRSWMPGDRIRVFGSSAAKKVKAVFAERKIPLRLRGRIPLLACEGRILSVGALCMAEDCRVTTDSREVLAVTVTWICPA